MLLSTGHRMAMAIQMPEAFPGGKFGRWLDLGTWTLQNTDNQRVQWAGLLRGWATDRIQSEKTLISEPERRDMMSTIINATDPDTGENLSQQEIGAEAYTLITAGSDTTATAISATFFYLSRNPTVYERIVTEIRSRFSSLDEIHMGPTLNGCRYLRACIDEALRMSAPVIAPLYREAGPGGATVRGIYVPEGYVAASQAYALHHNEKYYPDSFSYRPDRWLSPSSMSSESENKSISVSPDAKTAFFTFSHGTRNCAGINLAYLEISLVIARVLWLADLRIPSYPNLARIGAGDREDKEPMRRRKNEYQLYDLFASEKEGPMLEFRRR
jgi:cytochrome P450